MINKIHFEQLLWPLFTSRLELDLALADGHWIRTKNIASGIPANVF